MVSQSRAELPQTDKSHVWVAHQSRPVLIDVGRTRRNDSEAAKPEIKRTDVIASIQQKKQARVVLMIGGASTAWTLNIKHARPKEKKKREGSRVIALWSNRRKQQK